MITLTRMSQDQVMVNADLILFIEAAPETTITLVNGEKLKVREGIEEVRASVVSYKRALFAGAIPSGAGHDSA